MSLVRLRIDNLRNIRSSELRFCNGANLIVGPNGSGKTSLLESIDCLSRGRSFRTRNPGQLTTNGEAGFVLFGRVESRSGRRSTLGMESGPSGRTLRKDGENIETMDAFASALPVQVLHPMSHVIVNGSPGFRRAFMDWGVFHVKQGDSRGWREYGRALRQRNQLLRAHGRDIEIRAWDVVLAESAQVLDAARSRYVSQINSVCSGMAREFLDGAELKLVYHRGWPRVESLDSCLGRSLTRDRQFGYTGHGPHRADLQIQLDGRSARDYASRGQQKLVVVVLLVGQMMAFDGSSATRPTLLVDDLTAELDPLHRARVLERLSSLDAQIVLTALERDAIGLRDWSETTVFHVKHGRFEELL